MSELPPPIKSGFISAVAWIFIVFASLAVLISLPQNMTLVGTPEMQQMAALPMPPNAPTAWAWAVSHIFWFFRAFLLASLAMLAAAIGLLQRRNWARQMFIGLLAFSITYLLLFLAFEWWFTSSTHYMLIASPDTTADLAQVMQSAKWTIRAIWTVQLIGISMLFAWIIKRLCSTAVQREFGPVNASRTFLGSPP